MTPRGAERVFALGVGALVLLFLVRAGFLLLSPTTTDYGEGTVWAYARLLQTHGTYFLPIDGEPYIHGTYPPLFARLQALLGGGLRAGRSLAFLGTLLAASCLVGILRQRGVLPRRAWLWGGVLLATPSVHEWAAMCRVDTLALGLSLLGIYLAERRSGEILAAPILAAAFFAKQVAVAAPTAVFLSLVLRRRPRRAFAFGLVYAGLVLVVFGILDWKSGGEVRRHLITYTAFPGLAVGELLTWVLRFLFSFPVLAPLAVMALADSSQPLALAAGSDPGTARSKPGRGPSAELRPANWQTPAGVYGVLAVATLILSGKPGATANYLLEPSAACVLLGALAAERHLSDVGVLFDRRRDFVYILLLQLVALADPGRPLELRDLIREQRVNRAVVAELAAAPPGPVLTDELGLSLAADREPTLEPFQFGMLAHAGMFDPAPVRQGILERRYSRIVLGWRLRTIPGLVTVTERAYRHKADIGPYQIWEPNGGSQEPTSTRAR